MGGILSENDISESFELLAIITKEYPELNGTKEKYQLLTKGFDRLKYFNFLKVLKKNTVFSLNNNYDVRYEKDKSITIRKINDTINLYSDGKPNIQVNAIVGKNGSGKSTLSEILYLMLYNLAIDKRLVKDEKQNLITEYKGFLNSCLIIKIGPTILCIDFEILDFFENEHSKKIDSKNVRLIKSIRQEEDINFVDLLQPNIEDFDLKKLFYMISLNYSLYGLNELKMGDWIKHIFHKNDMYDTPIVINPYREFGEINVNTEDTQNNARVITNLSKRKNETEDITLSQDYKFNHLKVFYNGNDRKKAYLSPELKKYLNEKLTIVSKISGIEDLINITKDYNPIDFFKTQDIQIVNFGSTIVKFPIGISREKNSDLLKVKDYATVLLQNSKDAFLIIHRYFYNIKDTNDITTIAENIGVSKNTNIIEDLFSYFICKLYKIGINYDKEYGQLLNKERNGFNTGLEFEAALMHTLTSNSHACFKLKRVYYFLNFSMGKDSLEFSSQNLFNNLIIWKLKEMTLEKPNYLEYLNPYKSVEKPTYTDKNFYLLDKHYFEENDLSWRLPPSIFQTNCILENIKEKQPNNDLNELSSGETQFIYSLQTILYHLINIESNNEYSNVVLLLDEIELYYHPEYQRVFLSVLITQIKELKLFNIKNVQILFLTHSPFILSDISCDNVLFLKVSQEGKSEPFVNDEIPNTFGANINEMLIANFFMSSTLGEFARSIIQKIVNFHEKIQKAGSQEILNELNTKYLEEYQIQFNYVVNSIGDRVIQNILRNNLINIEATLNKLNPIELKKKMLEEELKKLEKQIQKNKGDA